MERTDEASKDVRRGGEELKGAIAVTELGDRTTDENDKRLLQKDSESQDKMEQQAPKPWRWLVIGRKKLPGRREAHWGYVERVTNDDMYLRSFLEEGESSVTVSYNLGRSENTSGIGETQCVTLALRRFKTRGDACGASHTPMHSSKINKK